MKPHMARRLRLYARERPRRGAAFDLAMFDAAIHIIEACFALAEIAEKRNVHHVERMRWASRRIAKAAVRRIRGCRR
jgi:hypothetical protein